MSTKSPVLATLDERLEAVCQHTAKVSALIHWLTLPDFVRSSIAEAFLVMSDVDIANRIDKDAAIVSKWRQQSEQLARVFQLVKSHKDLPYPGTLAANKELVEAVMELNQGASSSIIAKAIGHVISEATIRRWARTRAGIVEKRVLVKPGATEEVLLDIPAVTLLHPVEITPDQRPQGIGETLSGKKLAGMILRHEGKRRWKYSPAEQKLIVELAETFGSSAVHDGFGIAFDTISRLKKRLSADEVDKKARVPLKYLPVLDLMSKHPGMGPMQMRDYIRRHQGLNMGVNSIRRVMEQNGWVPPYARKSRVKEGTRHFEAIRKNFLWHADFKHHYINQCRVCILFFQDDFSRFLVGHSFSDSENIDTIVQTLEDAIAVHGKPESVMSDGGSAFYSWRGVSRFTTTLEDHGIDHYIAKSANVNGKIESVCCQVEKELLNVQSFSSLSHFQSELAKWVGFYNFMRPHQGIGDSHVPADRYYPGAGHWFSAASESVKQQSLIAETMMTLLNQLKKGA